MLNGWFTIAAQIVNFLVLVWLLKRFLYKPILDAIDQREKNIAAQLATAVATRTEAQKEHDNYEQKNKTFDQQRATMLTKATDDAKAERQKLIDQAHKDADALRAKAISALKVEQQQLNHEIRGWTQNQVFAIARKTLADLAAPSFEEALSDAFVVRLRGLNGPSKDQMATALQKPPGPAIVRSADELPSGQKAKIEAAIQQIFANSIPIQFEISPDLIGGVELTANGQKVSWNIARYLTSLEVKTSELFKTNTKSVAIPTETPKPGPQPKAPSKPNGKPASGTVLPATKGDK
jgi:F-type H+-transporting ATPase subunit b